MTIQYTYNNSRNNGRERVMAKDGKYYISSDWGDGFGSWKEVSREDITDTMAFTRAPQHIVDAILSE